MRDPAVGRGVSATHEDYLKAVWNAQEWDPAPVSTTWLAHRLGVGAPTVSETVRLLARRGLLDHEPYRGVSLTPAGRAVAVQVVRRHRLLETWLVEHLGYGWDEVHAEAEVLEHAVSDRFVDRVDEALGRPAHDPHGDPIPAADGSVRRPPAVRLADLPAGARAVVVRVSDADPRVLRECAADGVRPGVVLREGHRVSDRVREAVWVRPATRG
ncbi:metal-dependent transcriptional regulator [Actinotalea sp. Marseille-Q4924]|uniref:metal-dependent transcriptional regulator n=1 Tax=Actinotalea sp. Marseille-Q4924 TaxID=2866571 RepID=UPI001CE43949|nr:metal-dependent transcriptional regulator [Actinotalea sp. Marseille-Q4924]